MGCLTTDNCCCCFSLRTGGLMMGWLCVLSSISGIVNYMIKSDRYMKYLAERKITPEQALIICVIVLVISALYLYGIYSKRPSFMLPDVVLNLIGFFLTMIAIIFVFVLSIIGFLSKDTREAGAGGLIVLIFLFPFIAICWHFTAVSYSLYQSIKAENDRHPGVVYHAGAQRDPYKV